jgi:hypothetical protein
MRKLIRKISMVLMALIIAVGILWPPVGYAESDTLTFGFAMPALTHSYWIPI